jgi:hypothetical protein
MRFVKERRPRLTAASDDAADYGLRVRGRTLRSMAVERRIADSCCGAGRPRRMMTTRPAASNRRAITTAGSFCSPRKYARQVVVCPTFADAEHLRRHCAP